MGTPSPGTYAAAMYDYAGTEIARLVREHVPTDQKLLDIGAGWGKYRFLLPEYDFDAVEVWAPYVRECKLDAYYDNVFVCDAVDFPYPQHYGAVILGDVLEHIDIAGAQRVIKKACSHTDFVFVAVPYEMPQGECDGNHHEIHIQDDLTDALMGERYPELSLFGVDGHKAIYTKGNIENRNGGPG